MNQVDYLISKQLQRVAGELHASLEKIAGQPVGFSLVVYSSQTNGRSSYISNCDREACIKGLEALIKRWKENPAPDIPAHEQH